jgi:4-hydroxy-tetrahydrodipicolinate reductase
MSESKVRIVVNGALGRMGTAIFEAAGFFPEIEIVGAVDAAEKLAGRSNLAVRGSEVPAAARLADLPSVEGSVVVDFSTPDVTRELMQEAVARRAKLVVGTTGLSGEDLVLLHDASRSTAVLVSSNMSFGVQVLLSVVEQLARRLSGFDIEIVEMHHRRKKDAPSGTALALAEAAAQARGCELAAVARHGRRGIVGERTPEEIGVHAVRGGDIVGEHTVIFAGEGEHIEVRHSAHSRMTFAMGALRAAIFLAGKPNGYFTMRDVVEQAVV